MLLSYNELCELVEQGVITDVDPKDINAASIDVHLGNMLSIETYFEGVVDIAKRENFNSHTYDLSWSAYIMAPGEFLLAHTREKFYLPNDIVAEFRLKSSGARSGLENSFACYCDPGWNGSTLTLELKNQLRYHGIRLTEGMPIGQMIFYRVTPVPQDRSYAVRGRYNKDESVSAVKP